MNVQSLGWRTDLALLRLAGSLVTPHEDALVVRTPSNPGFHWGNFVLLPQAPTAEQLPRLLEQYAVLFPDCRHVAFGVDGINGSRADLDPLAAQGFDVEASVVMTAQRVQPPPRPNLDVQVRTFESDRDWAQSLQLSLDCAASDEAASADAARGARFHAFAQRRSAAERRLVTSGHGQWFGAFEGDLLRTQLGLVGAGDGLARFQSVETHPDARGRGIAGTLVHVAGSVGLDRLGAKTLVMVADPDYPAIRLYRSVGFADTETQLQAARH